METCWLLDTVEVSASAIEGSGLFATAPIPAGAVVLRLAGREVSDAELAEALATAQEYVDTVSLGGARNLVLAGAERVHFANHSCEPNLEHADPVTVVARRDIGPGEELTVDYAENSGPTFRMECRCGAPTCRGTVLGRAS